MTNTNTPDWVQRYEDLRSHTLGSLAAILRITILSDLARTCVAASRLMATETATRPPLDCR